MITRIIEVIGPLLSESRIFLHEEEYIRAFSDRFLTPQEKKLALDDFLENGSCTLRNQ